MKALVYRRSVARYLAVRALSGIAPAIATSAFAPLSLTDGPEPPLPGPRWLRVKPSLAGICGSDLATISCRGSYYFSAVTSLPCVLGHECVGVVVERGAEAHGVELGDRVVLEPTLDCEVRGIDPPCASCAAGADGNCLNVGGGGVVASGILTGYCRSTGGGFSEGFVAHRSQLHRVADELSDEDAVLIEPFACALHAVLAARVQRGDTVLVLGAGTLGLLTLLALKRTAPPCRVLVAAKHPHQAELARTLGADAILPAGAGLRDAVLSETGARRHAAELGPPLVVGGVAATFDCVASSRSLDEAVRLTRARGTVALVGMPARLGPLEGTALWFKETRVIGTYAYGLEELGGRRERTFALALREAAAAPGTLAALVTGRFPLARYPDAIATALSTGPAGAIKTVFDFRPA